MKEKKKELSYSRERTVLDILPFLRKDVGYDKNRLNIYCEKSIQKWLTSLCENKKSVRLLYYPNF